MGSPKLGLPISFFGIMKLIFISFVLGLTLSSAASAQAVSTEDKKIRDLIFQDIKKLGVDKDQPTLATAQAAYDAILIRAWGQRILTLQPVTPSLKETIYRELSAVLGDQEYKIVHFFVAEEKAARILVQKMKESNDWSNIDPKTFLPPETKFTLNRTDWINISAVLPEFRSALRALKKGEYTASPIRVKDGFHVVGLTDVRPFKMPSIESLDKELNSMAERKILDQYVQSLSSPTKK